MNKILRNVVLLFSLIAYTQSTSAQACNFSCVDHVYLGLDTACEYIVTIDDVVKDTSGCAGAVVELYDPYGQPLSNPLNGNQRGLLITYKVIGTDGNACWGNLTVEDKWARIINCENDTLNCWDAEEFINATPTRDNCGYGLQFEELHRIWVDYGCDSADFIGYVERSVISIDVWGNSSRCDSQRIYVIREYLDSLVCPEDPVMIECCSTKIDPSTGKLTYVLWNSHYVYEDEDGYSHPIPFKGGLVEPPYLSTPEGPHYIGSFKNSEGGINNGKCNIIGEYKDHIVPTCGSSYKIRREWKIFDWCTGEDTACIQWIKISDTIGPELEGEYGKQICLDGPEDCTNYVIGYDLTEYDECRQARTFYVKPHECLAHVDILYPEIKKECGLIAAKDDPDKIAEALSKIKVTYTIKYKDYSHPGKEIVITGDVGPEGDVIYLPGGWFQVIYYVTDGCWNETYACEYIGVIDNVAPTPVCDEITQVTLDPDSCWVRIYAQDLDDGSNDNCAYNLHFAVANMDTIEYYQEYWHQQLFDCYGEYDYNHYKYYIDELIEDWINCYIFNDYIDVYECGRDSLVMRVYEADGLPLYDDHVFVGSKHQWFCFNLYDDYACFFKYHYDEFAHYANPRADLCDYEFGKVADALMVEECGERFKPAYHKLLYDPYCQCRVSQDVVEQDYCDLCEGQSKIMLNGSFDALAENRIGIRPGFLHGPATNRSCCVYESPAASTTQAQHWWDLVAKYPELPHLDCKRYQFKHLYNDCMIEVIKDDKTPPVCIAPPDVSYYCDGVPVIGSIFPNGGNDEITWTSARFAHDICYKSDGWDSNCEFDRTDDGADSYDANDNEKSWCVAAPWDGGDHGYYGGPSNADYSYEDPCDENLAAWYPDDNYTWKPIYCRFWLMLDKYDIEGDGKPDPYAYFGEPEYYDNCWLPEITEETEGELDECGVGYLTRTWTVTDKCGNTSTCHQRITLKARSDFEVKFPADILVNCDELEDLSPIENDPATYPVVTDDDCELIGITYSDQVIDIEEDGCFKILRTWKVIDWCVFSPDLHDRYPDVIVDDRCVAGDSRPCVIRNLKDDGDGFMIYLQVIKVVDDVAPEVVCNMGSTFCIWDEECDDLYVEYELGSATDNCTEALQYRYAVNPNGDSPESDWIFGHGNILQNTLPIGIHTVILYAKDDCGNEGYCQLEIVVEDCKLPTPYCYDGIATVIMPSTGEITIWAKDFDAGSFDNCTEKDSLEFSFTDIEVRPSMTFTCEDIPGGDMTNISIEIWVKDKAGNQDFCQTYILLQDGSGDACSDMSSSSLISYDSKEIKSTKGEKKSNAQFIQSSLGGADIKKDGIVLKQNRPNPYQHNTVIEFEIEQTQDLTLRVIDIAGKVIVEKAGVFNRGLSQWKLDKTQLKVTSGILYYQLISDQSILTKKMVLIE